MKVEIKACEKCGRMDNLTVYSFEYPHGSTLCCSLCYDVSKMGFPEIESAVDVVLLIKQYNTCQQPCSTDEEGEG